MNVAQVKLDVIFLFFYHRVQREIQSWASLVPRAHQAPPGSATTVVQESQAHQVLPGPQGPPHYQGPIDLTTVSFLTSDKHNVTIHYSIGYTPSVNFTLVVEWSEVQHLPIHRW